MADITLSLNDRSVLSLPPPANGRYFARDSDLRGFHVVVGARKKTFAVKGEYWKDGKRFGRTVTIGHAGEISVREARTQAKAILAKIASGELFEESKKTVATLATPPAQTPTGITLRQAWHRYRSAHMERKDRSEATIRGYADHVERLLADWLDTPLMHLGENPSVVAERHDTLTE